jgi:acyl dehydratase
LSEGLPAAVQELIGRELPPTLAPVAVERSLVDHWLEVYEDRNPAYAAVAPPGMLIAWLLPFTWRPTTGSVGSARELSQVHFKLKTLLEVPHGIMTRARVEWHAAVRIGDRLSYAECVRSVSPRKQTRLGEGHFWTIDMFVRSQAGELVATQTWTLLGYRAGPTQAAVSRRDPAPLPPLVGDPLPTLEMPITVTRAIMAASANRDWQPLHHDREFARTQAGTRDLALGLWFFMGMFSRVATDWAGPGSLLRTLEFDIRDQLCPGDLMRIDGSVLGTRDGVADLELRLSNQLGLVVPATASVLLHGYEAAG